MIKYCYLQIKTFNQECAGDYGDIFSLYLEPKGNLLCSHLDVFLTDRAISVMSLYYSQRVILPLHMSQVKTGTYLMEEKTLISLSLWEILFWTGKFICCSYWTTAFKLSVSSNLCLVEKNVLTFCCCWMLFIVLAVQSWFFCLLRHASITTNCTVTHWWIYLLWSCWW